VGTKICKYLALAFGMISVVISVGFGNEQTQFVKPIFHVFLFLFYTLSVKRFNFLLFVFLACAMSGEYLAAGNFEAHFKWIAIFFFMVFTSGVLLIRPLLNPAIVKIKWTDILVGILVVAGLGYLVALVFILSANELEDFTYLVVTTVAFCVFIFSCFFIAAFGKHPKRVFLFVVGAGYTLVIFGTLIYELLYTETILLGIVNLCEVIAQFCFAYFLIYREEKINDLHWLV
jgi:hypothetical protein